MTPRKAPDAIIVLPAFPLDEGFWFLARWAGIAGEETPHGLVACCIPDPRRHGRPVEVDARGLR